jgi:aryl carrier-like protein
VLDALPQTAHGKVHRAALPAPAAPATSAYVAPRTPAEQALAQIWADVLHRDRVGVTDDFFDLGGHSLLAMQVVARVRTVTGADLSLGEFLRTPTVAVLAGMLASAVGGDAVLDEIVQTYIQILGLPAPTVNGLLAEHAPPDSASNTGTDGPRA